MSKTTPSKPSTTRNAAVEPPTDPKSYLRPAWNSTTRLGYGFDLTMADGSDIESDDDDAGGRRRHKDSERLTEDQLHNMRKFLNDERDAELAASPLYDRFEEIDPDDRALRSDQFWGRWMVCTPPDYSTRPGGEMKDDGDPFPSAALLSDDDTDDDDDESWKAPDKLDAAPEEMAAAMSQQDNMVAKWSGSLRRAGNSPRDDQEERPYCCECGKVEVANIGRDSNKHAHHVLIKCKNCDFIYCRDCWRLAHKYGTMRHHRPCMLVDVGSRVDYTTNDRAALLLDLMRHPVEETGVDGKASFFDRMHTVLEENERGGGLGGEKHLTAPYGASSIVLRSGVEQLTSPREAYVRDAARNQFLPEPSVVRRGGGRSFNRAHFGLGATRIAALHQYLKDLPEGVEDIDLTDNRLDDKALAGVLRCLKGNKNLKRLRICKNEIKDEAAKALASLLKSKHCSLVELDVSRCQMNSKACCLVCDAIAEKGSKCTLEKLILSENKIRGDLLAKAPKKKFGRAEKDEADTSPLASLVQMLKSSKCTVTELSLSGNPLGDGGGVSISKALRGNRSLTSLDLQMSGLDNKAAAAIGESLKYNKNLETLNVSYNRYGDRGATALAAGVRKSETLQNINASHTHISEKGVRSLLAAVETLAGSDDMARNVRLDGTDLGLQRFQQFDIEQCTGKYFLDLGNSYERAILQQLLRASKQHRNILWQGPPQINGSKLGIKTIELMHRGRWKPPRSGVLEVSILLTGKRDMPQKEELDSIYKKVSEGVKKCKAKEKMSTLAKLASTEDLHIDMKSAQALLSLFTTKERGTALLTLLPCLLNHEDAIKLAQKNLTKKDQIELDNQIGLVYGFSPLNPTGRYRLDLKDFYQRLVAIRCLQISNEEGKKCRRSGGGDTSQHGNYMGFRNETIGGRPIQIAGDQVFPPYRTLQFDFVSSTRAPAEAKPMTAAGFKKMCDVAGLKATGSSGAESGIKSLKSLLGAKKAAASWKKKASASKKKKQMVSPAALMAQRAKEKVEEQETSATTMNGLVYTSDGRILRRGLGLSETDGMLMKIRGHIVTTGVWLTIDQVLALVGRLPPQPETGGSGSSGGGSKRNIYPLRIDVLVACFARIIDHSDFCWRIMRTLHAEEQDELVHRLGWLKLFDPYHPEGLYKLNLERAEDRRMALLLLHVCAHEEMFFWKDTTLNGMPMASIPAKWSRGLPEQGRLVLTIDKDPNVESEYESDDYSDSDDGYVATPRRELVGPLPVTVGAAAKEVVDGETGGVEGGEEETTPRLPAIPGASSSKDGGAEEHGSNGESGGGGKKKTESQRKILPSGNSSGPPPISLPKKLTFSNLMDKSQKVEEKEEEKRASHEAARKQKRRDKPKRDNTNRRRRLTAMTKQHVMPSTLLGSLMMQDKWEQKRIKKKHDKKMGKDKPISYSAAAESSSDESSSDDEGPQVNSLLNIEREDSSDEEEEMLGFQPDDTVFAGRVDVCDSGSFYDDKVLTEMLEMDWERCIREQPKVKSWFVKQHKKGLLLDAIPEAQEELFNELLDIFRKHMTHLYNTFDFYAVMGNGTDAGQIQMNQYSDLMDDCNITEPNRIPQCNRGALDRIFIVTNREDDQEDGTADANDDRALMRFEFLEAIMRIAVAKFIETKKTDSLPAAVKRLLSDYFATNKGEGSCNALIDDPTEFRREHVYTQETDKVLRKEVPMLNQMFHGYCRSASKGMLLQEWLAMLKDMDFFNYDFTSREAKLAYVWSKSRVIDEVKGRESIHRMNLFDFMEGLLRIAQLKPLPAPEDITKLFLSKEIKEENLWSWMNVARNPKKAKKVLSKVARRSSDWGARQTRSHAAKMQVLLNLIRLSCDEDKGHTNKFQLGGSSRMNSAATRNSSR